ncbi:hypothetical protein HMPREF0454_04954 [Hafnia alvei ATCC 51873]|uniref:Uncharacterized protein n=1 Tax=Hafnia alvei ATCC 51873 TaxID=1002364 RepID=G9YEA5_HAFAL|nr:hypothetical protein HMPREF0454_04954 [Hafnia alvei ATCC 51873]
MTNCRCSATRIILGIYAKICAVSLTLNLGEIENLREEIGQSLFIQMHWNPYKATNAAMDSV